MSLCSSFTERSDDVECEQESGGANNPVHLDAKLNSPSECQLPIDVSGSHKFLDLPRQIVGFRVLRLRSYDESKAFSRVFFIYPVLYIS
jgi:hypothetical protein